MAIAFVGYAGTLNGGGTSLSLTIAAPVVGNLLVVWLTWQDDTQLVTITNVTDNKGNGNYSVAVPLAASPDFGAGGRFPVAIYYLRNVPNTGASFTITVNFSGATGSYIGMGAAEFSGADTTSPLDQQNTSSSATATTGYNSSASVTTSATGDLSVSVLEINVGISAGAGWTLLDSSNINAEYKIQGAAGAYPALWTGAASISLVGHATFKPVGAAPANRLIPYLIGKLR